MPLAGRVNFIYDFQSQQGFKTADDKHRIVVEAGNRLYVVNDNLTVDALFPDLDSLHYGVSSDNGIAYISNEVPSQVPYMLCYLPGAKTPSTSSNTTTVVAWGYWKMDEATGTRLDASGNNRDLPIYNGTVSYTSGQIGTAALFENGSTLVLNDGFSLDSAHYSIMFWAYIGSTTPSVPDGGMTLRVDFSQNIGTFFFHNLYGTNKVSIQITCGFSQIIDTGYIYDPNSKHFVVVVGDGNQVILYVDNVAVATYSGAANPLAGLSGISESVIIGQNNSTIEDNKAWVDELVCISDVSLSPSQVSYYWNGGTGRSFA